MFQFHLHIEKYQQKLAVACAEDVAGILRQAIASRGRAFLALSGGKSPLLFLQSLFGQALDWSAVTMVPVDERWVALDHVASNEKIIRDSLANSRAAAAQWLSLYAAGFESARAAQAQVESRVATVLPESLDIVVLGMGEDGHTASWFPQSPQLEACFSSKRRCLAVDPMTAEHERITLTAPYVLKSRHLFVYAPGAKKIATLAAVLQRQDPSHYPVTQIFHHPHLHWWTSSLP